MEPQEYDEMSRHLVQMAAHCGPAPGAPRRPHACRDAAPPRRRQELGRYMPGDAAVCTGAAGGAGTVWRGRAITTQPTMRE